MIDAELAKLLAIKAAELGVRTHDITNKILRESLENEKNGNNNKS